MSYYKICVNKTDCVHQHLTYFLILDTHIERFQLILHCWRTS